MYSFNLDTSKPNQRFSTVADGFQFDITLNTASDMLFATIAVDGVVAKTSVRCVPGGWLIPYMAYAPDGCGNFRFLTRNGEYPNYRNFNESCILVYYSAEEIKEMS